MEKKKEKGKGRGRGGGLKRTADEVVDRHACRRESWMDGVAEWLRGKGSTGGWGISWHAVAPAQTGQKSRSLPCVWEELTMM